MFNPNVNTNTGAADSREEEGATFVVSFDNRAGTTSAVEVFGLLLQAVQELCAAGQRGEGDADGVLQARTESRIFRVVGRLLCRDGRIGCRPSSSMSDHQ